jgi:hypothetical protein
MISFDTFDLDDGQNYIVTNDDERGQADRTLSIERIANREGVAYLGFSYDSKKVNIEGIVFADDVLTFQAKLDALKKALAATKRELIFNDRIYTATLESFNATTTSEAQTTTSYSATFDVHDSFAKGAQLTSTFAVTSGVVTLSGAVTISGTIYTRPIITYYPPAGSGDTLVNLVSITHVPSGQVVTWSGTGVDRTLNYGGSLILNYDNLSAIRDGSLSEWSGIFSLWTPGVNDFVMSFEGLPQGGSVEFSYNPRYL